jgi:membrane protein insertase, YidC/Oxa1 family, N-terminal domain
MDRNSIIGIVLIVGILIMYSIISSPSKEQKALNEHIKDSIVLAQQQERTKLLEQRKKDSIEQVTLTKQQADSLKEKNLESNFGSFATAAKDTNRFITIENNVLKVKISTKGGRPYMVELKKYKRFNKKPLDLFNGDSTKFGLNFFSENRSIATNDLFFKPFSKSELVTVKDKADSVAMRLYAGDNSYIEYVYTLKPDEYMVKFNINFVNMDKKIDITNRTPDFIWSLYVPRQEQGVANENNNTNIHYKYFEDEDDYFSATKKEESKVVNTKLKWVAFKQQFFSSVIIAGSNFGNGSLHSEIAVDTSRYLKHYSATLAINYESKPTFSVPMSFYFGPNHFPTLKKYNLDLEKLVFLGRNIIRVINQYVIIPIFNWLNQFISNFGIIILLLTLIIKMALFPLTYKSYQSQAKMRVLKPQIDEINARIPKDKAMERQQATMNLYKKAGVNPLGGCLPMLLQFPILIAMFRFFPTSIELRQQSFLWAHDLSTYDSIVSLPFSIPLGYGNHVSLFTILMTITTILSMKMSNQTSSMDSQMPGMKTMMYIMPVMFMFFLNSFSAGLTYYYFLANVITIGQNEIFRRMIDEEKLLKKIHANKAKPQKKSKFQERLEKMARERGYKTAKK